MLEAAICGNRDKKVNLLFYLYSHQEVLTFIISFSLYITLHPKSNPKHAHTRASASFLNGISSKSLTERRFVLQSERERHFGEKAFTVPEEQQSET